MSPKTSPYMSLHPSASTLDLSSNQYSLHKQSRSDDLEDTGSETTLASEGLLYKHSNTAPQPKRSTDILTWLRFSIIVFLQGMIIVILLPSADQLIGQGWNGVGKDTVLQAGTLPIDKTLGGSWTAGKTETGGDINGLYIPSKSSPKV